MLLSRRIHIYVPTIVVCSMAIAQAGGGKHYPGGACGRMGVACVPPRMSYGYYPTTWRRWPTDTRGQSKKSEPEPVPTPPPGQPSPLKKQEQPGTPMQEQPPAGATPEALPTFPVEPEPGTPGEPQLPFPTNEEFPPRTPAQSEPPAEQMQPVPQGETTPMELPPQPPTQIDAAPDQKEPTLKPSSDDPFGDEQPRKSDPTEESVPRGGDLEPRDTIEASPKRTFSWHASGKAVGLAASTTTAPTEPRKVEPRAMLAAPAARLPWIVIGWPARLARNRIP